LEVTARSVADEETLFKKAEALLKQGQQLLGASKATAADHKAMLGNDFFGRRF
jgi:hypothetical protein